MTMTSGGRAGKAKANGIEIAYEIHGEENNHYEPLVLIAGLGYGQWFWHAVVPELARRFKVITFDNRGAGESSKPSGPYTVPMMAADSIELLRILDVGACTLLGHSLGGFIAQEIAVTRPDLISRLILASTGFGGPYMAPIPAETIRVMTNRHGSIREIVMRGIEVAAAKGFAARNPEMVERLMSYRMSDPVPMAAYAAQFAAGAGMGLLSPHDVNKRMKSLMMPTLILSGDDDRVVPSANANLMASKIAGSRVEIIADTGHFFPLEKPDETVRLVSEFIAGDRAR
jgi:pimeloyl-ACP methyl ester carboxylesterase